MIKVIIGTTSDRKEIVVDPSTTLKAVLEENGIDYSRGGVHLDGLSIGGAELNKSFTDHGITTDCMLLMVLKSDGNR